MWAQGNDILLTSRTFFSNRNKGIRIIMNSNKWQLRISILLMISAIISMVLIVMGKYNLYMVGIQFAIVVLFATSTLTDLYHKLQKNS